MRRGGFEQDLRLVQVGFQDVDRRFHHQIHAHGRREVKNGFSAGHQFRQFRAGGDLRFDDAQPGMCLPRPADCSGCR